jgi:hypothetical protein
MGNCKSCGAPIRWVKTATGKAMPLDANPTPKGNVIIVKGVAQIGGDHPDLLPGEALRFTSHFATCPNASQHRR